MSDSQAVDLVRRVYRNSRGKLDNLRAKSRQGLVARIRALAEDLGPEELEARLKRYLDDENPWLVRNRWPIAYFLKHNDRWASEDWHKAVPRGAGAPMKRLPNWRRIVADWRDINWRAYESLEINEIDVLEDIETEGLSALWNPEWDALVSDEFISRRLEILIRGQAYMLARLGRDVDRVSLAWFFRRTGRKLNWERIIEGRLDWATRPMDKETFDFIADYATIRDSFLEEASACRQEIFWRAWSWYRNGSGRYRQLVEFARGWLWPERWTEMDCPHWMNLYVPGYKLRDGILHNANVIIASDDLREHERAQEPPSHEFLDNWNRFWGEHRPHKAPFPDGSITSPWIWVSPKGSLLPCYSHPGVKNAAR